MSPYRRVKKEIRPEITRKLASEVDRLATETRQIQQEVRDAGNALEQGWVGKAKQNFFSKFGQIPGKLRRLGEGLAHKSRELRTLTFIIEVVEKVEDIFDGD